MMANPRQPDTCCPPGLPEELLLTLRAVAAASADLVDDWWVIGSAAMALVGLRSVAVPDVDVVTSRRDADALSARWRRSADATPVITSTRFRSEFGRYLHAPLPVEVMGDLEVKVGPTWHPIRPRTRVRVTCGGGGHAVYVPSLDEQIEILGWFARPKDLVRATALESLRHRGRPADATSELRFHPPGVGVPAMGVQVGEAPCPFPA